MDTTRMFRVIVVGGIGLVVGGSAVVGCGSSDTSAGDAAADVHFPSEGPDANKFDNYVPPTDSGADTSDAPITDANNDGR